MKYYKILDCDNYDEINEDIIKYLTDHTSLLIPNSKANYCNFVPVSHFIINNPKLDAWFRLYNLRLRDIYFTLTWKDPITLHTDKPPVGWKLNWPVLNTSSSHVRFFHPKRDIHQGRKTGDPNSKDNDNTLFDYGDFEVVEQVQFTKPMIMYGLVQHDAWIGDNAVFPRIGIQCMFLKEPTHLL